MGCPGCPSEHHGQRKAIQKRNRDKQQVGGLQIRIIRVRDALRNITDSEVNSRLADYKCTEAHTVRIIMVRDALRNITDSEVLRIANPTIGVRYCKYRTADCLDDAQTQFLWKQPIGGL